MKKCFKCGNNVLPGTSTCPGCGSAIRNNTNTKQSYTPTVKSTGVITPRRVHDTVSPGSSGYYKTSGSTTAVVLVVIFMFVLIPIIYVFTFVNESIEDFEDKSESFSSAIDTEIDSDSEYVNYEDYIEIVDTERTEHGEIVVFLKNNYTEELNVEMNLKYLDENGSELSKRFGYVDIAPGAEQVMVFTKMISDFSAYKYSIDVINYGFSSSTTIDLSKITTTNVDNKLIASYVNDSGYDLELLELCALFYDGDVLKYADCGRDYDIVNGDKAIIEYNTEAYFPNLTFDRYKYYLREATIE